jgi:hypothetical protein
MTIDFERSTLILNNEQLKDPFNHNEQIFSYIIPQSYVKISSNCLMSSFFKLNNQDSILNITLPTKDGSIREKRHLFNEETSPIYFQCILVLTTHEDFTFPIYFDNSFWVSGITQTMAGPSSITYKPSNQFYIRRITGFGKFIGWSAAISVLFLLALVTSWQ